MLTLLLACAPKAPQEARILHARAEDAGLEGLLVVEGALENRVVSGDSADLVLFYGGEERGSLEPCGCPNRPRGGMSRLMAYVEASRAVNPGQPDLLVNGGYWLEDAMGLDGQTRPDTPVMNRWMIAGMQQTGFAALNVTHNDAAGISSVLEAGGVTDVPAVSANVTGPGIERYRIVEVGGLRVGITGISPPGMTWQQTPGFATEEPGRAAPAVLEALAEQVDVVVLLAYQTPEVAQRLAKKGLVDVVIDTNLHREFSAPFRVGDAVWVRSHIQTMRLGELRLGVADGQVTWATDRKIDLDAEIPSAHDVMVLTELAREELDVIQQEIYRR
ncbi:MAG: 2',3'-cyclic-nucleotide 2'-phosphodiesterase (5'-nucleotidase family) [Myxococcota bacterium]|jgi:2',3'-cyclic-nucleotide 2'-phosphodiesterase (5'-nucleotidase family)